MEQYYHFLEKEQEITKLYNIIYKHSYFKNKDKSLAAEKQLTEELEQLQKKIDKVETQKQETQKTLDLEQNRLNQYSEKATQAKDQDTYFLAKNEKEISVKFIELYQNKIKEDSLLQKDFYEKFTSLKEKETNIHDKAIEAKDAFEKETKEKQLQYNKLLEEQDGLLEGLEQGFSTQFKQLRQKKIYPSLVAIKDPNCPVCSISFPAQIFQQVLTQSYSNCPNCLRILLIKKDYFDDKESAP